MIVSGDNYFQSSVQARDGEQQQEELLQGPGRGGEVEGGGAPGAETGADDELQQHRQTQAGAAHRGDRADPSSL